MFKLEFGIIHHHCPSNQLSRQFPELRIINPGGFVLGPNLVEEIAVIDQATDESVADVLQYISETPKYVECELLERTAHRAFIRWRADCIPEEFCSQVVERNRGFKIGMEEQRGGLEHWMVGCYDRQQAEQLVEDLKAIGDVEYSRIHEESWQSALLGVK